MTAPESGGATGGAEPVAVRIAHVTQGRARLRLARALGPDAVSELVDRLAAEPGVSRVRGRPNTRSVIVEADLGEQALEAMLRRSEALRILPPEPPVKVGPTARLGLMKLDHEIGRETGGSLDLKSALAVLLVGGAVIQLWRGQVAGPATTLLVSALALLEQQGRS